MSRLHYSSETGLIHHFAAKSYYRQEGSSLWSDDAYLDSRSITGQFRVGSELSGARKGHTGTVQLKSSGSAGLASRRDSLREFTCKAIAIGSRLRSWDPVERIPGRTGRPPYNAIPSLNQLRPPVDLQFPLQGGMYDVRARRWRRPRSVATRNYSLP